MITIQHRIREAVVQPFAPFAVQCRRQKMPEADQKHVLGQHQQDQHASIHGNRHKRVLNWGAFDINDRVHQKPRSLGDPDSGFADEGGENEDRDCKGPGFFPAVGYPIGAHKAPKRCHLGHGRAIPYLKGLLFYLPYFFQYAPRIDMACECDCNAM